MERGSDGEREWWWDGEMVEMKVVVQGIKEDPFKVGETTKIWIQINRDLYRINRVQRERERESERYVSREFERYRDFMRDTEVKIWWQFLEI